MRCFARFGVLLWFGIAWFSLGLDASGAPSWEQNVGFRKARVEPAFSARKAGFSEMPPMQTGVTFTNQLDDQTVLKNQNLMLGSGVAAGDFDGDGWCDLYFCALTRGNALYRNHGGWRFDNVTTNAGVELPGNVSTGAVFADVDGDGDLDLLVSSLGHGVKLFLNDGRGGFRDATGESGLSSRAGSMTMALGDVDGDGDLDLFVCNYGAQAIVKSGVQLSVKNVNGQPVIQGAYAERLRIVAGKLVELGEPPTLFLNDGRGKFRAVEWGTETFLDEDGKPMAAPFDFGLSAQMRDVNGDGAPDIYVCNDFDTPDRFWINDGHGRFRLLPRLAQRSQSYASMGVDFADIDRDGHVDFFVVEMLAAERARRLWQMGPQVIVPHVPGTIDNRPQVARNTLFHSRGDGTFDEIANFAGVAASDWSWQGAFLDVDLDGYEDILTVNGHLFDVQDLDVPPPRSRRQEDVHAQLLASPRLFVPKRAWRNRGDLTFEDHSAAWSFNDTNICHGIALADLDNDGDLDAVANRLNASAWLLRNEASAPRIAVRLKGNAPNTRGIGAKITLHGGAIRTQAQEIISGGKYLSGDEAMRVFATERAASILLAMDAGRTNASRMLAARLDERMTLEVAWRSGLRSVVSNVQPNCIYEIDEVAALRITNHESRITKPTPLFTDVSERLKHVHAEPGFDDFQRQPLLARKLSQRGPGLCVTDLDGDDHDDLLIGTGRGGKVSFFRGDGRGGFSLTAMSEPVPDDVLALAEWSPVPEVRGVLCTLANYETARAEMPLLWLTWEAGELVFNSVADASLLPDVRAVGHCLATSDFDADGDLDVFMGGHSVSGRYPEAAPSLLFRNERGALKTDATNSAALRNVGLVNSALWTDLDNDGWPELVLACEWGPVRIFKNTRGQLTSWNAPVHTIHDSPFTIHQLTGWWTGIASADLDEDGRMDLVVGNWGLNGSEHATSAQPLQLYYGDFMNRGIVDLLEAEYDGASRQPMPARRLSDVSAALPVVLSRFPSHRAWAASPITNGLAPFKNVRALSATTLATTAFLNRGDRFEVRVLPSEAQWSSVWSVNASDFDGDGHADVFLSQNSFAMRAEDARLDAGRGLLLRGDGKGNLTAMSGQESGLMIYGEQRAAAVSDFDEDGRPDLIVTQNANTTRLYRNTSAATALRVRLIGPPANPRAIGAALRLVSGENLGALCEIHGGSGWLSQNSTTIVMAQPNSTNASSELRVRWPGGRESKTVVPRGTRAITANEAGKILAP